MIADFRPASLDIQMWKNDTWQQVFSLTANNSAINLSAATVTIQVRTTATSPTAALTLTEGAGITVGGSLNNQITLKKIVDISAGVYVWDLQVLYGDGTVKTYLEGSFEVYEDVTKI